MFYQVLYRGIGVDLQNLHPVMILTCLSNFLPDTDSISSHSAALVLCPVLTSHSWAPSPVMCGNSCAWSWEFLPVSKLELEVLTKTTAPHNCRRRHSSRVQCEWFSLELCKTPGPALTSGFLWWQGSMEWACQYPVSLYSSRRWPWLSWMELKFPVD